MGAPRGQPARLAGGVDDDQRVVERRAGLEARVVERREPRVEATGVDVVGAEAAGRRGDEVLLAAPAAVEEEAGTLVQLADQAGPVGRHVDQARPRAQHVDAAQAGKRCASTAADWRSAA